MGDIRSLKKSSIDWDRKTINLKITKTGQPIELPLLKDIGWAIIDYLQNGRPATNSKCLFVRHRVLFNAFGDRNGFNKELHRYILKAAQKYISLKQQTGMKYENQERYLRHFDTFFYRNGFEGSSLTKEIVNDFIYDPNERPVSHHTHF